MGRNIFLPFSFGLASTQYTTQKKNFSSQYQGCKYSYMRIKVKPYQVWWCMPLNTALSRQKQEDLFEFQATQGYAVRPFSNKNTKYLKLLKLKWLQGLQSSGSGGRSAPIEQHSRKRAGNDKDILKDIMHSVYLSRLLKQDTSGNQNFP